MEPGLESHTELYRHVRVKLKLAVNYWLRRYIAFGNVRLLEPVRSAARLTIAQSNFVQFLTRWHHFDIAAFLSYLVYAVVGVIFFSLTDKAWQLMTLFCANVDSIRSLLHPTSQDTSRSQNGLL